MEYPRRIADFLLERAKTLKRRVAEGSHFVGDISDKNTLEAFANHEIDAEINVAWRRHDADDCRKHEPNR